MLRSAAFTILALLPGLVWSAEIPRPAPELVTQLTDGKQLKVSDYRGKVLCLTFILTT